MRTIELREYQRRRQSLTQEEVRQLLEARVVALSPCGGGEYDVIAGSVVGTVVLPALRLLIRPKVGLRNLFFLLGYGAGLTSWAPPQFPYQQEADFLRAVAWVFEAEVRRALVRGVVRGYQHREETLATLRGRLDVTVQLRRRQGRPFPLDCRFEEYTEDVTLNRVLKAASERLLNVPGIDLEPARRLRAHGRAFSEVTSVAFAPAAVPDVPFTRLDRHWEAPFVLARLILRQRTLRDQTGTVAGVSFTVDMNTLFERFVEQVVRETAQRAGLELAAQAQRRFSQDVRMYPDLLLRRDGRDAAVADAKYKEPDNGQPVEDLYQMLAYCVTLGLPAGLLIYGGPHPLPHQIVRRAGIRLELTGIDLSLSWRDVLQQARDVATQLIAHVEPVGSRAGNGRWEDGALSRAS